MINKRGETFGRRGKVCRLRACSSIGQSERLIIVGFPVQVRTGLLLAL